MSTFLQGPAGRLEALLWTPKDAGEGEHAPRAAAVVCHPHPLGGGTMANNVVFRVSRGLQTAGLAVLRFNFRGVGQSEGQHDGTGREQEDLSAALDALESGFPLVPLWAAGYSFGARTAAELATRDRRIARLLCVALPCKAFDCSMIRRVLPPTHVIQAERDSYGNLAELVELAGPLPPHVDAEEIPGVDHSFTKQTPELEARVRAWAQASLDETR